MHHSYKDEPHALVRKMESIANLTSAERDGLLALPMSVREIGADEDIVREGDRPSQCCLLLDKASEVLGQPHTRQSAVGLLQERRV